MSNELKRKFILFLLTKGVGVQVIAKVLESTKKFFAGNKLAESQNLISFIKVNLLLTFCPV